MLKINLIRHGETPGNALKRYIGITDESLSMTGIEKLSMKSYEMMDKLYVSPMKRCIETAKVLFGEQEYTITPELSECNFGSFENKNYIELAGNKEYQAWIDSNGTLPFPNGESRESFRNRTILGFEAILSECIQNKIDSVSIVVHGGSIMNIMEKFSEDIKNFYDWHVGNGDGYQILIDQEEWIKGNKTFLKDHVKYLK